MIPSKKWESWDHDILEMITVCDPKMTIYIYKL